MSSDSTHPELIAESARSSDRIIDRLSAQQQETLDRMDIAGQALLDGLTVGQREIADFVAERIRRDIETQKALMACRTLDDLRGLQADFMRNAFDQYFSEMARLLDIGRDVLARSAKPPVP